MDAVERSYYCSMKFRYLKINFDSNTIYNCHAAIPQTIDFKWLEQNPGNLFNTELNVVERQMMLDNQRNSSCEPNCWSVEDRNGISARLHQGGETKTHTLVRTTPEILEIALNSDCNLTCSYCCKEYSNAWRRDLLQNGNYADGNERYSLTNREKLLLQVSQPELKSSNRYNILLQEIQQFSPKLKKLIITGGEPLLDNKLIETLESLNLSSDCVIELYTGLGISYSRFVKVIKGLEQFPNLLLRISSENIGRLLEFTRYGIKWNEFEEKINFLKKQPIRFTFHSTVSNLTAFGFQDFYNYYQEHGVTLSIANQPTMMSLHVLDNETKNMLSKQFINLPDNYRLKLSAAMQATPSEDERKQLREFLFEFTKRRPDLDLAVYSESFLNWLELEHVV